MCQVYTTAMPRNTYNMLFSWVNKELSTEVLPGTNMRLNSASTLVLVEGMITPNWARFAKSFSIVDMFASFLRSRWGILIMLKELEFKIFRILKHRRTYSDFVINHKQLPGYLSGSFTLNFPVASTARIGKSNISKIRIIWCGLPHKGVTNYN